ncbi:hypothetical protein DE146DRAFT_443596 [Phaeosphaeria sp. MPI-PUGE-AT-0046c]|nr:hypothetical protein DE146DRAFT_443596 [Phaeosphaeria sp. MPI-PUGE-AT-0046c]
MARAAATLIEGDVVSAAANSRGRREAQDVSPGSNCATLVAGRIQCDTLKGRVEGQGRRVWREWHRMRAWALGQSPAKASPNELSSSDHHPGLVLSILRQSSSYSPLLPPASLLSLAVSPTHCSPAAHCSCPAAFAADARPASFLLHCRRSFFACTHCVTPSQGHCTPNTTRQLTRPPRHPSPEPHARPAVNNPRLVKVGPPRPSTFSPPPDASDTLFFDV